MTGFFAAGRWWDLTEAQAAQMKTAVQALANAGISDAAGEVQMLFALDPEGFEALVAQRANRIPLSHLRGYRDFYKSRFKVSPDVLDPRPETEVLVTHALTVPFKDVLDLGTGSGAILLSLLTERETASGMGTDLSTAALKIAAENARALALLDRVTLIQSDWYAAVTGAFDLIVSNPPYIALDEMDALQPEVRDHEPRMALTDEGDGLSCYRAIIGGAAQHLRSGGALMVEIGPTQGRAVAAFMENQGFAGITVLPDLDGRDRVVSARYHPK